MADNTLAGSETLGTFTPVQLFAGEADIITDQGIVASGQNLAQYQVVALVSGKLVKWNTAGSDGSQHACGIMPHAIDASSGGYNADTKCPYYVGGVFNFAALAVNSGTFAQLRTSLAANNNNVMIRTLG